MPKKVWVCKIVSSENSPTGYRLKDGKQPIHVSINSIDGYVNGEGAFSDRQPSFVVASDDSSLCARSTTTVVEDVVCPIPGSKGSVKITTTTAQYFGTTAMIPTTSTSTRMLTAEEFQACGATPVDPPDEVVCPSANPGSHGSTSAFSLFFSGLATAETYASLTATGASDAEDCDPVEQPLVATAEISFTDATCVAPQLLNLGPVTNATWGAVTDPAGSDDYSVTATAIPGAEFAAGGHSLRAVLGATTMTFTGALDSRLEPSSPKCDLATLGLVMPAVNFSQASCSAAGSYTLGVASGYDPALVTFTVNGVSGVASGLYSVAESGSVAVSAQAVAPNGIEFGWTNPPAFSFNVPSDDDCATPIDPQLPTLPLPEDEVPTPEVAAPELPTLALPNEELPTLAYTGAGELSAAWWLLPMSLIALGGAAVYVRRRNSAGH